MKINYRPEIDGLRAISVLAVIFYHADFSLFGHALFQGGFIGVDIFFVISGYLITSLILKEINHTNQFSFKNFYERRIRRILPVLLAIIIISSIVSYFILMPYSLIDYGKSILSVILFSSNIYFWITGSKYGAESEFTKPMLHTWSLSIEEEFYILFPIFFIILIKFYKKRNKLIIEILDDIKGPNVYRIYLEYLFCNTIIQNRCVTNNKEHLFYYDNNHLSLEGSKYVVNEIMKTIQQIKINEKN